VTDCERVGTDPQGALSAGYSSHINAQDPVTYTVVSASHADMENLPDYDVTTEATFASCELAEAHADALNDEQGHSYLFWVLG